MTKRDRSAERRVAEFLSQNVSAPVKKTEQADDLFTAAEKDQTRARIFFESVKGLPCAVCDTPLAMTDGETVFVIGTDLACSQKCADKIQDWSAERTPIIDAKTTPDVWGGYREHRTRLPERFIEQGATAPGSETSARAADAIGPTRYPKAYLVYQHIKSMGKFGATRQELVDALAISLQTICSLVRTLYQCGLIGSNEGHVRSNRFSGMANEVMLHEDHVTRWQPDQPRPPQYPKWMNRK